MYSPSFKKELNRLYTIRWIEQHKYGREHTSWKSKLELREMVNHLDIKLPMIYEVRNTVDELVDPSMDSWVLKPAKGAANRGVYPIIKKDKKLYNVFTGKVTTFEKIKQSLKKQSGFKPPFIIEEYLGTDTLPYNWELYCFKGKIGLIRQRQNIDNTIKHYKFYDIDFKNLGLIEQSKKDILDESMPLPHNPDELLRVARVISENIPFTFCRVDLYDTEHGVYFGELTHHPGVGNNFDKHIDEKLGRMWLEAEAR